MQVNHDIFHLGIVDRALSLAAPGVLSRGEAVVDADQIDRIEIEVEALRVRVPPAEDVVKLALGLRATTIRRACEPAQSVLRAASSAACPESLAAWETSDRSERIVSSARSRLRPSSPSRCVPVSFAAS